MTDGSENKQTTDEDVPKCHNENTSSDEGTTTHDQVCHNYLPIPNLVHE